MQTLPSPTTPAPLRPTDHWWTTPAVNRWLHTTWRYYAWRPGYQLRLNPAEPTAWVNMRDKVMVANPCYPYPPVKYVRHIRGLPQDLHAFQLQYLEGLIAHEAGHTHFSGDLPPGLLGQLVNIVEDHRMERLMARDFPHLATLFQFACDVDAAHALHQDGAGGSLIRGCLLHRFTQAHPHWAYEPAASLAPTWDRIRPMLEAAWDAPTYDDCVQACRAILALIGEPEDAPRDHSVQVFLEGDGMALEPMPAGQPVRPTAGPDAGTQAPLAGPDQDDPRPGDGTGRPHGAAGPARPERPAIDPALSARADQLLSDTAGDVRRLVGILRVPHAPSRVSTSRDRGRLRVDRAVTRHARPFDHRVGQDRPVQAGLRIAVDISSSMGLALPGGRHRTRMDLARHATFMLVRAAQLSGTPVMVTAFDHQIHPVVDGRTTPLQALNGVADLRQQGDTALSPALQQLHALPFPGPSLTIVITDGDLTDMDYAACRAISLRSGQRALIPILIHASDTTEAKYVEAFGQCVHLAQADQLIGHLTSFLRSRLHVTRPP